MSTSSESTNSSRYSIFGGYDALGIEKGVKCDCGPHAPVSEAWRKGTAYPGRRFFGCSRCKDEKLRCGFFMWADMPYHERAKQVIEQLMEKLTLRLDQVMVLREDVEKKDNGIEVKDALLIEMKKKMQVKDECLTDMEKELKLKDGRISAMMHALDGKKKIVKGLILFAVVSWLCFTIMLVKH